MGECISTEKEAKPEVPFSSEQPNTPPTTFDEEGEEDVSAAHPPPSATSPVSAPRRHRRKSSKGSESTRRTSRGSVFSSTVAAAWSSNIPPSIPSMLGSNRRTSSQCTATDNAANPFDPPHAGGMDELKNTIQTWQLLPATIQYSLDNDQLQHSLITPVTNHANHHHHHQQQQQQKKTLPMSTVRGDVSGGSSSVSDVAMVNHESEILF